MINSFHKNATTYELYTRMIQLGDQADIYAGLVREDPTNAKVVGDFINTLSALNSAQADYITRCHEIIDGYEYIANGGYLH